MHSPRSPLRHNQRSAAATIALCSNAKAGANTLPASQPALATNHIVPASTANSALN